jgi:integrase
MARQKLTAKRVEKLKPAIGPNGEERSKLYGDGGGLWLRVDENARKTWIFRFRRHGVAGGKAKAMGLGSYPSVTLESARQAAVAARSLLQAGIDPIAARHAEKKERQQAHDRARTFEEVAKARGLEKAVGWRNPKSLAQWQATMESYVFPHIGQRLVSEITVQDVLKVLTPIWGKIPVTASRVRMRIEDVLDYAKAHGLRDGDNPADWKVLRHILTARRKMVGKQVKPHVMLHYRQVPALVAQLAANETVAAQALLFCALTGARTSEVRLAEHHEINLDERIWTIPPEKMKRGEKVQRRPLSSAAVEVARKMMARFPADRAHNWVFPGKITKKNKPLGHSTLLDLMTVLCPNFTTHGLRASFRSWGSDMTDTPVEVMEMALGHAVSGGDATVAAYARGEMLAKRFAYAEGWAAYCTGTVDGGNVVRLDFKQA